MAAAVAAVAAVKAVKAVKAAATRPVRVRAPLQQVGCQQGAAEPAEGGLETRWASGAEAEVEPLPLQEPSRLAKGKALERAQCCQRVGEAKTALQETEVG